MSTVIRLELASHDFSKPAKSAEIILYDDIGPLNSWKPLDQTSFTVNGKQLMFGKKLKQR